MRNIDCWGGYAVTFASCFSLMTFDGRLAQGESAAFTRQRSAVRNRHRLPLLFIKFDFCSPASVGIAVGDNRNSPVVGCHMK